ncbi:hypothetical protein DPMN_022939 [Dreissena polymorpha]|uniref:Uncharacterized protein n=1 Tax=Dreissena polymorpha TaxID=45954 RepID=A0A9D4LLB7_DREPO|nr:hypothetical protein DPMN_022939 [Dreissena polymorpha]
MPPSTIPEVKPLSPVIPWASAAVSAPASKSNGNGDRQGVPISMNLFQKWSVN